MEFLEGMFGVAWPAVWALVKIVAIVVPRGGASVQPDECSNCSDFRIRRRGCDRTGLRSQWNGHKQNNGEGNSLHSGSPDEKMGREQYSGLNMQADGFYCVGPTVPFVLHGSPNIRRTNCKPACGSR